MKYHNKPCYPCELYKPIPIYCQKPLYHPIIAAIVEEVENEKPPAPSSRKNRSMRSELSTINDEIDDLEITIRTKREEIKQLKLQQSNPNLSMEQKIMLEPKIVMIEDDVEELEIELDELYAKKAELEKPPQESFCTLI